MSSTVKKSNDPLGLVPLFETWRELALAAGNRPESLDSTEMLLRELEPDLCAMRLRAAISRLSGVKR